MLLAAKNHVALLGWDFDTRAPLLFSDGKKFTLAQALRLALETNPQLRIYVLCWDYAAVYMFDREFFPDTNLRRKFKSRIFLEFDGHHPSGASHHQKIIVVDGSIAFSGGMDLGLHRWDTRQHVYRDPRRTDFKSDSYLPYHDVQAVLTGPAVSELTKIVKHRWQRATGQQLVLPPCEHELWPQCAPLHFKNIEVQIARTMPRFFDEPSIREVEAQFLELIAAAQDFLYIENQYFSSEKIERALEARLAEANGPEIVMIMPLRYGGWFESRTVGASQARFVGRLRSVARPGKFRAFSPVTGDLHNKQHIHIHAKILVADNFAFLVGSANFNNRSLGFDTECNMVFLASPQDAAHEQQIERLRNDLISEHLGCSVQEFEARIEERKSIIAAIDSWPYVAKGMLPASQIPARFSEMIRPISMFFDPVAPMPQEILGQTLTPPFFRKAVFNPWVILLFTLLMVGFLIAGFALMAKFRIPGFFGDFLSYTFLNVPLAQPSAWLFFYAGVVLALLLFVPFSTIVFVVAWSLPWWPTVVILVSATLTVASSCYFIGWQIGSERVFQLFAPRLQRLRNKPAFQWMGFFTVAWLRVFPVAAFSVISMALGAIKVPFVSFFLGTLAGMLPLLILISKFVQEVKWLVADPSPQNAVSFGLFLCFLAVLVCFVFSRASKRRLPPAAFKKGSP